MADRRNLLINVKEEDRGRERELIYLINDFKLKQRRQGVTVATNFDALEMLIFKALGIDQAA